MSGFDLDFPKLVLVLFMAWNFLEIGYGREGFFLVGKSLYFVEINCYGYRIAWLKDILAMVWVTESEGSRQGQ